METETQKKINKICVGNVMVESDSSNIQDLLDLIKKILKDKTIKDYLSEFEKRELMATPSYIG